MERDLSSNPFWNRVLDHIFVLGFVVAVALWVPEILQDIVVFSVTGFLDFLAVLAAVFFGALAADFFSGFVHWFADNHGHPDWPILGPSLIRPFREHHVDPASIVRHDFFETNGSLMLLGTGLLGLSTVFDSPLASAFLLSLALLIAFTNQIHKWAHSKNSPKAYRILAKYGLLLSPKLHGEHHRGDHDRAYCITVGVLNRFEKLLQVVKGSR